MRTVYLCVILMISNSAFAGTLPHLHAEDGTIFSADHARDLLHQCSRYAPEHVQGTWLPELAQIRELEARLPQALANALMKRGKTFDPSYEYVRQYGGIVIAGHKIIYVNAVARDAVDFDQAEQPSWRKLDWRNKAVLICDGGSDFFGVEYDPGNHSFEHFEFNGAL